MKAHFFQEGASAMNHENPEVNPSSPAVLWERLGEEVLVCDQESQTVYRLAGTEAENFLALVDNPLRANSMDQKGHAPSSGGRLSPSDVAVSRRLLIGAVTGGAMAFSLALPAAAQGSSSVPKSPPEPTLITADLTLANWGVNRLDFGFFVVNRATLARIEFGDLFELGDEWELELTDYGDNLRATATVAAGTPSRRLLFDFTDTAKPAGELTARLRSTAKNLISSLLAVPLIN